MGLCEQWRQDWRGQWQAATNILLPVGSETTTNLAMILREILDFFFFFFFAALFFRWVLDESLERNTDHLGRNEQYACAQAVDGFSLCPLCSTEPSPICPSLNICCGGALPRPPPLSSHLYGGGKGAVDWQPNPPVLSGAHLPARLSWLPTGNWDIPPHSPLITKVTWHMYSWRSANLHCGHILPRPLSVSARCPFEASLPSRVIKDPSVSHLAGPIIKSET